MAAFTRKHYVEIAALLKGRADEFEAHEAAYVVVKRLACDLAKMFERDNPCFNRARFLGAAGVVRYRIERVYKNDETPPQVVRTGATLAEAQAHCKDPATTTDEYMDTYEEER